MALNPDDLKVETFPTSTALRTTGSIDCCTGCTSGCGIYPTNGGCESVGDHGSDGGYCPITIAMPAAD